MGFIDSFGGTNAAAYVMPIRPNSGLLTGAHLGVGGGINCPVRDI